jgi:signal transduction histidine kinase
MIALRARATPPSLSRRLLGLTCGMVLLIDVLFLVPTVVRARCDWLRARLADGQIAALSITGQTPAATRADLLRLAGVEGVEVRRPGLPPLVVGAVSVAPEEVLDLSREDTASAVAGTLHDLLGGPDRVARIEANDPVQPETRIAVTVRTDPLTRHLRALAGQVALLGLALAAITGVLMHMALGALLVRPIRRLTDSIAAFRADPERTPPIAPGTSADLSGELALAARELAGMQSELRVALWRQARLAALGTAAAKVSHDLRGVLAPALLSAERLQSNADPGVRRIGDVVVRGIERATELVRSGLDYAREGPVAPRRDRLALRGAVAETVERLHAVLPGLAIDNRVEDALEIEADPGHIDRILTNLLRNAGQAGARRVTISATIAPKRVEVLIDDDGPGLPATVRDSLFKPFVDSQREGGSGLGLAIARDLMRALRGDIALVATGPGGTCFRLSLPISLAARPPMARPVAAPPALPNVTGPDAAPGLPERAPGP